MKTFRVMVVFMRCELKKKHPVLRYQLNIENSETEKGYPEMYHFPCQLRAGALPRYFGIPLSVFFRDVKKKRKMVNSGKPTVLYRI